MPSHERLMHQQDGLLTRRQALEAGLTPHDIRRSLRRREWQRVHPGVYLDHTGPPTWKQRAWAAVLYAEPAALAHDSALRWLERDTWNVVDGQPIHIAVERNRRLVVPPGIRLHRLGQYDRKFLAGLSPARMRPEHALVDKAVTAVDEAALVAVVSDAIQQRRTTTAKLRAALASRTRIARRRLLHEVLDDLDNGAWSVLERGYLTQVERPHGLPPGRRQARHETSRGVVFRDVLYPGQNVALELDGRTSHGWAAQRAADLARDLNAAAEGLISVRLGWAQVFTTPCSTAYLIAGLLRQRGWPGHARPCARCIEGHRAAA